MGPDMNLMGHFADISSKVVSVVLLFTESLYNKLQLSLFLITYSNTQMLTYKGANKIAFLGIRLVFTSPIGVSGSWLSHQFTI